MSILTIAIEQHNKTEVEALLNDSQVILSVEDLKNSIAIAAQNKFVDILGLLLKDGRFDPAANDNFAIHVAALCGHLAIVELLLKDERVNPAVNDNYAFRVASQKGHLAVVELLLKDERVNPAAINNQAIRVAAQKGHLAVVERLLKDKRVNPAVSDNYLISWAAQKGYLEVFKWLLNDERVNPADSDNYLIRWAALNGHLALVELLLKDKRVNPADNNNQAIRVAAQKGHLAVVELLLKDERVNPATNDNAAISLAAQENHSGVVRLLLPLSKYLELPFTIFVKETNDDIELLKQVSAFTKDPVNFIATSSSLTDVQRAALNLLMLKRDIKDAQIEETRGLGQDTESAMRDGKVLKSKEFYKHVEKQFSAQYQTYGKNDNERVIVIEKNIRALILDSIASESKNENEKIFIEKNREVLTTGLDEILMKQAREQFFNTSSVNHAAWRGYDTKAPFEGYDNLLTIPEKEQNVFATGVSHQGAITNIMASNEVRKMMAHYYLLTTDAKEPHMLESRKINFISELKDLRLAHQKDHEHKPDAPSCYPGYLGRMLNLAFAHPLSQYLVTPKEVIASCLSTVIVEKFKSALEKVNTHEECDQLLNALSWLRETAAEVGSARDIILDKTTYGEDLLKLRNQFSESLGNELQCLDLINQALKDKNEPPLDEIGRYYIRQHLLDPARENMGKIAAIYSDYVQAHFTSESMDVEVKKSKPYTIANPYSDQCRKIQKLKLTPSILNEKLQALQAKEQAFNKLMEDRQYDEFKKNEDDSKGIVLLFEMKVNKLELNEATLTADYNEHPHFEKTRNLLSRFNTLNMSKAERKKRKCEKDENDDETLSKKSKNQN